MDRKKFIKTSGMGLGLALMPGLIQGQNRASKNNVTSTNDPKIIKETEGNVLHVIGDVQTHKISGKDTGNQIVEWVSNVEPGVGIPPHIHTKEDEIFRVVKGEVEIMVGGKTTLLKAGDVAFAPRDVPHAWTVVGTEKAQIIASAFPAGIEDMFAELAKLPPGPPDFGKVAEICAKQGISFV
ncbi:cupin domain-containing protein [Flagellimonas sp. GZD32]|uniref:cupin domain-containing protein n=1 Tax=Flagellimonas cixiensis TaxID=3228750 RepID=UPI0035C8B7D5